MGNDSWYYAVNGQQIGPLSAGVLRQMLAGGQLAQDAFVWREGMPEWQAATSLAEFADVAVPVAAPAPPVWGVPGSPGPMVDQFGQPYAGAPHQLGYQQFQPAPTYSDATSHYQTKFRGADHAGTASTAMTLSIVGLFCVGFILGPIALAMGIAALNGMSRSRTSMGKGQAITAIVLGGLETLGTIFLIIVIIADA